MIKLITESKDLVSNCLSQIKLQILIVLLFSMPVTPVLFLWEQKSCSKSLETFWSGKNVAIWAESLKLSAQIAQIAQKVCALEKCARKLSGGTRANPRPAPTTWRLSSHRPMRRHWSWQFWRVRPEFFTLSLSPRASLLEGLEGLEGFVARRPGRPCWSARL